MEAKRTEWVFGNQMEELRRNTLDEEKHRMVFGKQMVELRKEYDGWEWVFGNQMVELRTVCDGWETDRTSSPEGNHRDLQDLCRSVTWGVTTAIVIFSRINFVWEIWRDWCCEVGEFELFLRVSGIGYWAGIAMDL